MKGDVPQEKEGDTLFKRLNKYLVDTIIKPSFGLPKVVEVFLMMIAFWWAFVLLLPTTIFTYSGGYVGLLEMAGETAWGMYFIVLGMIHFAGLQYGKHRLMLTGLMMSTVTWMLVGLLMLFETVATTGAGTYIMISLLSASTYFYKGVKS
jgi:hypothetical protein